MAKKTKDSKNENTAPVEKPKSSDAGSGGCCSSSGCYSDDGKEPCCGGAPEAPKEKPKGGGCGGGCGCK
ncbi:MAG TPA: hypothetical protein VLB83_01055 [Candidatus Paceibacterota bacterium]|nr:hypothetical protein [Candidatus Paceibacterota bacterium]